MTGAYKCQCWCRGAAPMGAIAVGIVAGIGAIEKGGLRARGSTNGAMLVDPLATVKDQRNC